MTKTPDGGVPFAYSGGMSIVTVNFPGGVVVDATYKGHTVRTDQPLQAGGSDSAMSPFDLLFASMATCMGFYALRFCQERSLPHRGIALDAGAGSG